MDKEYSIYEIRVRAVEAVRQGMAVADVAKAYQANRSTVHRWVTRYETQNGNKGLLRQPVSGRPRILGKISDRQLLSIVLKPASSFGYETDFWTCPRLCRVIRQKLKIKPSRWTVWRWLRNVGLTYQKPERTYFEADEDKRQEWIKRELPRIRRAVKKYRAILYFQDESHISLTALLGRTWSPRGKTPIQEVTGKRGGVSAMSAISKNGSLIFTLLEKRIASDEVIHFLKQMLKHHPRRHLVVVMDQAPPHKSKKTQAFIDSRKRLHVFYLPSYSPAWNPDEYVWNHLKHQELKGHQAKTKAELKVLTRRKLKKMAANPQQLRGIFFRCCVAELLH
jgi:transposase